LLAIAIEIAHRYWNGTSANAKVGGGAETARAIPQQDWHIGWAVVGNGEVLPVIAVEIAHRYWDRITASAEVNGGAEIARAIARCSSNRFIRTHGVAVAVAVAVGVSVGLGFGVAVGVGLIVPSCLYGHNLAIWQRSIPNRGVLDATLSVSSRSAGQNVHQGRPIARAPGGEIASSRSDPGAINK